MKKLHIALLVASFVIPSISFASIDTNLKYGSRGVAVTELQDFLIEKGFLSGQATGNFFSLTREAVVAYQSSVGLPTTGYVGPMTRTKINDDLSISNASAISAEIKETGTITPTQENPTTSSLTPGCSSSVGFSPLTGQSCSSNTSTTLPTGCSSTTGFSPTTGKRCSDTATATPLVNKTVTLTTGAVVEIDTLGNIVRTITSAPIAPSTPSSTPTTTPSPDGTALSISLGDTITTINSAHLSWNTNIPTESKLFLTDKNGVTNVHNSQSGLSTHHLLALTLSENSTYSYKIEAISGSKYATQLGSISSTARIPTKINVVQNNQLKYWYDGVSIVFTVSVEDQSGSKMIGSVVTVETSSGIVTSNPTNQDGVNINYRPLSENKTEHLVFRSGGISTSLDVYIPKGYPVSKAEIVSFNPVWGQNASFKAGTVKITFDDTFSLNLVGGIAKTEISGGSDWLNSNIKLFIGDPNNLNFGDWKRGGTYNVDLWASVPATGNSGHDNLSIKIESVDLRDTSSNIHKTNSIDLPTVTLQY